MLDQFNMTDCNPSLLPWSKGAEFTFYEGSTDLQHDVPYNSLVGSLLWASVCTRPDISDVVSCLCRYVAHPKLCYWTAAKRVLHYLKGTSHVDISVHHHSQPLHYSAFVDSTLGSEPASSVFVSGKILCIGPVGATDSPSVGAAPISWRSAL
jgi:hypothetical protein